MRVLKFKISGPLAHFRKFYTNSSSLTYDFPPRTVITGIIGAILGFERHSYYEKLSSENFNIGVNLNGRNIKSIHSINYIRIKSPNDAYKQNPHTSIPTEFLMPSKGNNEVSFNIFVSGQDQLIENLKEYLLNNRSEYPVYLGSAYCNARTSFIYDKEGENFQTEEFVEISSVIPFEKVQKISFEKQKLELLKDIIPIDFKKDRSLKKTSSVIYERNGNPIKVKYSGQIIKTGEENIIFLK